ncbi:hypothetical protein E2C01_081868 [Portunus trituberculatus]|uniref:Uncharacterized protein n=1 Tax=Portunus trituberculatus TaxID=210409 RepID=A0A5B7IXL3_PORTR|nr:hypothetical protein [Portunus trituberculatus]
MSWYRWHHQFVLVWLKRNTGETSLCLL